MQVSLNTQKFDNTPNFTALKKVEGERILYSLIGDEGSAIVKNLTANLKANESFQTLCDKYDVFVKVQPHILGTNGIFLDKGLSLKIFAKKLGVSGLFAKKEKVTGYMAAGVEARTWDLAAHISETFIKPKDGMDADIIKFLQK